MLPEKQSCSLFNLLSYRLFRWYAGLRNDDSIAALPSLDDLYRSRTHICRAGSADFASGGRIYKHLEPCRWVGSAQDVQNRQRE
jgi:hypothetical protein